MIVISESVCPWTSLFKHSLMFVFKAEAYPKVEPLNGGLTQVYPALLANIRLGEEGLPRTNTFAYYEY